MAAKKAEPIPQYRDLADYFRRSGDTQSNAARVLGLTQGHLSNLTSGLQCPRPALAHRLASYCRIPENSFIRVYNKRHAKERIA
jgi:transcriptional regulator with XRE-family HTH domain